VKLLFRAAEGATVIRDAPSAVAEEQVQEPGRASVLVIDDDPDVRSFVVASLEDHGYRVSHASDGEAGLVAAAAERPDLVILDFIMPGLSGAEVASRLLADRPDQQILFVSGYSETEAVRRVAPNAPLLSKPFRAQTLESAVRSALLRH
jgi:DNA-binding response OmpR family regulator